MPNGAEQLDEDTPRGRKQRSTFFNYFVFCLASGALIAVTFVVWIEDNKGWEWGFGISTMAVFLSIPVFLSASTFYRNKIPTGSPLTTIAKVLIAATMNACSSRSSRNVIASLNSSPYMPNAFPQEVKNIKDVELIETPSKNLKFLNRAIHNEPSSKDLKCSLCYLAQLSTYSVEQAASMDRTLGSMKVPPASLPIFPVIFIMILAPTVRLYARLRRRMMSSNV
ncbi:transporter [Lithospermum erythrorhizon]|uniref:Transporter n=1 Tax=Lithospermum erythrorhizon TaxID=34254 RepID=A0AAV3PX52_LITER